MLKLMYITNRPEIALIAEEAGVDRIFIDLEVYQNQYLQIYIHQILLFYRLQ